MDNACTYRRGQSTVILKGRSLIFPQFMDQRLAQDARETTDFVAWSAHTTFAIIDVFESEIICQKCERVPE